MSKKLEVWIYGLVLAAVVYCIFFSMVIDRAGG
jgi:hypothetical protein